MRLCIVAGEPSGDALGGALIRALSQRVNNLECFGVGGEEMCAAGLRSLFPLGALSINGFVDPLMRLPRLVHMFARLRNATLYPPVDAFIGIDFNVFNLLLERSLKKRGLPTIHYVSPSVYAWRPGRARRMRRSTDLVLTLFPFEPKFYEPHGVAATFVGHPLAARLADDEMPALSRTDARAALGLSNASVVTLMPGSRRSEILALGPLFLAAARRIADQRPDLRFVVACPSAELAALVQAQVSHVRAPLSISVVINNSMRAIAAADVVLCKAGTSTLEALLLRRPMVVAYRLGAVAAHLVRSLLITPYVALPNILAGRPLVPELLQEAATPERLAAAVLNELNSDRQELLREFGRIGDSLVRGKSEAAEVILQFLATGKRSA